MRLVPPVYFAGVAAVMAGLDRLWPAVRLWPPGWVGMVPAVAGCAVAVWAAVEMRRHRTTIHPYHAASALVVSGPFGVSRNPIYLGMVLILLGLALSLGSLTPFLGVPVFMLLLGRFVIAGEESRLMAAFGEDFLGYTKRVRRWF